MPVTTRHLSSIDLEAVYDEVMPKAIELFNKNGQLPPVLLLVSMAEEEGAITFIDGVPPQLTNVLQRTKSSKNLMMALIASLLHEESPVRATLMQAGYPRPDLVVHLTDAWCLTNAKSEGPVQGSLAEHPDRHEALLIAMHTAFGTATQMLPVEPDTRQVAYSPFEARLDSTKGRMQIAPWLQSRSSAPTH